METLKALIEQGYLERALQRSPHLTLLNVEWYHQQVQPVMAEWALLWLEQCHVSGLSHALSVAYLNHDGSSIVNQPQLWSPAVESAAAQEEAQTSRDLRGVGCEAGSLLRLHWHMRLNVPHNHMRFLNLASEWIRTYLPHVLQKVNRVSYGLLSMSEYKRLLSADPLMPRSRVKLAIPFAGKDVPSSASEYAHPDITVGLTIVRRRQCTPSQIYHLQIHTKLMYSPLPHVLVPSVPIDMRVSERMTSPMTSVRELDPNPRHSRSPIRQTLLRAARSTPVLTVGLLRSEFEAEVGPFRKRKSSMLYEKWVHAAGGEVKGAQAKVDSGSGDGDGTAGQMDVEPTASLPVQGVAGSEDATTTVPPLFLMKQSNHEQADKLFRLLRREPAVVHWYLEKTVFPTFMCHQRMRGGDWTICPWPTCTFRTLG